MKVNFEMKELTHFEIVSISMAFFNVKYFA